MPKPGGAQPPVTAERKTAPMTVETKTAPMTAPWSAG